MTSRPIALCAGCIRLRFGPDGVGPRCDAFPNRVPDAIWQDGFDHRNPYRGDHGIRFLMKAGGERALDTFEREARRADL